MKVLDLIPYVLFQLSKDNNTDPVVKAMTEEEVQNAILMQMAKLELEGDLVPSDYLPIFMCLLMKEMYWKLALASAPLNDVKVEDIEVKKGSRFEHYYKLVEQMEKEYQSILNDPSRLPDDEKFGGKLKTIDLIIDKPYCHNSYVQAYKLPKISAKVDSIEIDYIYLSIDTSSVKKEDYRKTVIRASNTQIMDVYANTFDENAKIYYDVSDVRRTKFKLPNSNISHVLIAVTVKNGLTTYYELEVNANVNS